MLTISENNREHIELAFNKRWNSFPSCWREDIQAALSHNDDRRKTCLKFLLAFMPDQDICSYPISLFEQHVDFSLAINGKVPWGNQICDDIFLNYVLMHRINNEDIEFCLDSFSDELLPRIQHMGMKEAAIEVNYWCFEKAVYQSTDLRTISPSGIVKRSYGRCGEESSFFVAALRSVGIPARQVYTPRWAHCDDNHAWVEIYVDGTWQFIGACEPEPQLNSGWFCAPASRAMLIHSKVFSTLCGNEDCSIKTDYSVELNILNHYAEVRHVTITVVDNLSTPVSGASVQIQLVNFSELYTISSLFTDEHGQVYFKTGKGDFVAYCRNADSYALEVITKDQQNITIVLHKQEEVKPAHLHLIPPVGAKTEEILLDPDTKKFHDEKLKMHNERREKYMSSFFSEETALDWAKIHCSMFPYLHTHISKFLQYSCGNHEEIVSFLLQEDEKVDLTLKVNLLSNLNTKDFSDITSEILMDYAHQSLAVKGDYSEEIFIKAVINPRIEHEMITKHRKFVRDFFTPEERQQFISSPQKIFEYIQSEIQSSKETRYSIFYSSPIGALRYKTANEITKRMLFVAVCRSIGIPAYINKTDQSLMFYHLGGWNKVEEGKLNPPLGILLLQQKNAKQPLESAKEFTVAIFRNNNYSTLDLEGTVVEGELSLHVEIGDYRIITTNRLSDGSVLCNLYYASVSKEKTSTVEIALAESTNATMKSHLNNVSLRAKQVSSSFETISTFSLLDQGLTVIACLKIGEEPTEHLLNEIIEGKNRFQHATTPFIFLVDSENALENKTFQAAVSCLRHLKILIIENWEEAKIIFSNAQTQDSKCPLLAITDQSGEIQHAWSGYHVGIGSLIIKNIY